MEHFIQMIKKRATILCIRLRIRNRNLIYNRMKRDYTMRPALNKTGLNQFVDHIHIFMPDQMCKRGRVYAGQWYKGHVPHDIRFLRSQLIKRKKSMDMPIICILTWLSVLIHPDVIRRLETDIFLREFFEQLLR